MIYSTSQISVEICRRLGIELKGKVSGQVMTNHGEHGRRSPCLSIDLDRGLFKCFSCGEGGTLRSMYFEATGHGIFWDMGIKSDDVTYEPYEEPDPKTFEEPPEVNFEFSGRTVPAESCHRGKRFLESRGFDREISKKYNMKFVVSGITRSRDDPEDRECHINFRDRVIIPIYEGGVLISLEGRDTLGERGWREKVRAAGFDPSTMNYKKVLYPKLSSVNSLYGLASLDKKSRLYIVEGLMDMISLRTDPTFRNSTAFFGAGITRRQMYLLDQFVEVCLVMDDDAAGVGTLKRLMGEPDLRKKLKVLLPPAGCKDVNDILQGKNPNVRTVTEAIEKNWLSKVLDADEAPIDVLESKANGG